jgi:hypothetical protein
MWQVLLAAAIHPDPYTAPVDPEALALVQVGVPLKQAEAQLAIKFKLIGTQKNGTQVFRHWTTANHGAKAPQVTVFVRDGMIDQFQTKGIYEDTGSLLR